MTLFLACSSRTILTLTAMFKYYHNELTMFTLSFKLYTQEIQKFVENRKNIFKSEWEWLHI